jgi:dUTP pyrophosphatase
MIKFNIEKGVKLPKYESENAVGFDVVACNILKVFKGDLEVSEEKFNKMKEGFIERGYIKIRPFERILFSTGLTVAHLPDNIELQIRSRSGVALKRGLFVANQPGTVDPDYRGVIGVILYNSTPFLNKVEMNERIAQIVPKQIIRPAIELSEHITDTERGSDGFGSSGKF